MLARAMGAFDGPIHLHVGRSRRLLGAVLLAHGAALGWTLLMFAPGWAYGAVAAALAANALRCVLLHGRRRDDDVVALLLKASGRWQVTLRDGRVLNAELTGAPLVSVAVICLSLRLGSGQRRDLALLGDNVAAAAHRRLRVRLRHVRRPAVRS